MLRTKGSAAVFLGALLLASLAGCGGASSPAGSVTPTQAQLEKLSDKESMVLLRCQTEKVQKELGAIEGERYISEELDKLLRDKGGESFLQYELAKDGYYCTAEERKLFAKEQRRAQQEALWGPARGLEDVEPGIFGGVFASDVEYKIDREHTGYWMNIAKVKELAVSTTAASEAELLELAKTLKEKESGGFDFTRAEYFGGKKNLAQKTYDANGTICILRSKDGLALFADQYPTGPAYEQAKEDFAKGDGIVFLGSTE